MILVISYLRVSFIVLLEIIDLENGMIKVSIFISICLLNFLLEEIFPKNAWENDYTEFFD